jgi:surfactin synthase thioesterase subunit
MKTMDPEANLPGFTLSLHHPLMQGSDSIPPGAFPLIIFQHGEGQSAQYYRDYWEAIVPLGVLVADGDFTSEQNTQSHQTRPYTMRCVAEYLADTHAASLNFDLVLAGHSRGGFAALRAAKFMLENPGEPANFPSTASGHWPPTHRRVKSQTTISFIRVFPPTCWWCRARSRTTLSGER